MVSGFLTSPCDHSRIFPGDAIRIRIPSKSSGSLGFSKSSRMLSKPVPPQRSAPTTILITPIHRSIGMPVALDQFNVKAEALQFLDQNIERLWQASVEDIVTFHDCFIHTGAPSHIVRFDGQHLLQGVCGPIGFESPNFHLTQALSAKLGFTSQWLLCDKGIGTRGTSVNFIINQVVQLHHINVAHRNFLIERLAGLAVIENRVSGLWQSRLSEQWLDVLLARPIENRRRNV